MSDILDKFTLYFKNKPDYWKLSSGSPFKDYTLSYYPISFKERLANGHYRDFDPQGLPLFKNNAGNLVHFVTGMCSFALAHWHMYLDTGIISHASRVIDVADYIIGLGVNRSNGSLMVYDYDNELREDGRSCAMNQGESISVLCRAYLVTRDEKYLESAVMMAVPFNFPYGDMGVLGSLSQNGKKWYLEGGKTILNGHIYALFGLRDLSKCTNLKWVDELCQTGLKSVNDSIGLFDTGWWSWYWLEENSYIASAMYHNLHICQLFALYQETGNVKFKEIAERFTWYSSSIKNRMKAGFMLSSSKLGNRLKMLSGI